MRVCPRHRAVVVERTAGGWRCFICQAVVEPGEVEEPSTAAFGVAPNLALYDCAIRDFMEALRKRPHDPRILQKLGEIYMKKNDPAHAADFFVRVAEEYEADGQFFKAIAVYRQVVKLDAAHVDASLHLATLYEQLGQRADAVAALEAALQQLEKPAQHADPSLLDKLRAELARLRSR